MKDIEKDLIEAAKRLEQASKIATKQLEEFGRCAEKIKQHMGKPITLDKTLYPQWRGGPPDLSEPFYIAGS